MKSAIVVFLIFALRFCTSQDNAECGTKVYNYYGNDVEEREERKSNSVGPTGKPGKVGPKGETGEKGQQGVKVSVLEIVYHC